MRVRACRIPGGTALHARLRARLRAILWADASRMAALDAVRRLGLPDGWIGAGFVRNAVWDRLHGRPAALRSDIDVVWFDPDRADAGTDLAHEAALSALLPGLDWSVRNQARMHERNRDPPYRSVADALRFWPETATAVAVRLSPDRSGGADGLEILAPFGLLDLFALHLRPTPRFCGERLAVFETRVRERRWCARWPGLRVLPPGPVRPGP